MSQRLPLWSHPRPDSVVARRGGDAIATAQLLADAVALADRLPEANYVFNGCDDRYWFTVGMAAALMRGQISILPNNQTPHTLSQLAGDYERLYALRDSDAPAGPLPCVRIDAHRAHDARGTVPQFDGDRIAAVLFTSGSTGRPVAHPRRWSTMVASAQAEALRLGIAGLELSILGTVPPQHSYGLESTVMLALHGGGSLCASRPFFPADVFAELAALPQPRMLVTTPVHLRALLAAATDAPPVGRILCATAPLATDLATAAERRFGAELIEIYGATESGQLATRRTTAESQWTTLPEVRIECVDGVAHACGGHVPGRVALSDVLQLRDPQRFALVGRSADMVNIGGKRSSLAFLNQVLLGIDGVDDGAFCVVNSSDDAALRLVALVVAPALSDEQILAALRERIDPLFLPRPLRRVDSLPRDATGKLSAAALQAIASRAGVDSRGGNCGQCP